MGVIYILQIHVRTRKLILILITLLLISSLPLIGCSSLTSRLSNQSTPTSTVSTPDTQNPNDSATPTDITTLKDSGTLADKITPNNSSTPAKTSTPLNKAISTATANSAATDISSTKKQAVSQPVKITTPTKESVKNNTITISKTKYNQLEYGYSYEKVKRFLGGYTGEIVTESGTKGSKSYTVTYLYHVKSPSGAELFLAFKDDKLVNKMEVNLQ